MKNELWISFVVGFIVGVTIIASFLSYCLIVRRNIDEVITFNSKPVRSKSYLQGIKEIDKQGLSKEDLEEMR